MLYRLLFPFHTSVPVLNVTGYITFRTAAASLTALAIAVTIASKFLTMTICRCRLRRSPREHTGQPSG